MQATAEWLDIDFYDVLGVDKGASNKQIKSAYRKLARSAHPDANPDDEGADARFSNIAKAYEVLGDEHSRAEYDDLRAQAQRPATPADFGQWSTGSHRSAGFVDIGDLFGDLFAEEQSRPRQGADVAASLGLEFVEAVQGLTTTLIVDGRSINVRIPAGVQDQQTIRLHGKGGSGSNGGPPGDLLIQITVHPHSVFARLGRNLTTVVTAPYEDFVLGGQVSVPTIDGSPVTLRIPPGTSNGQRLRVKGKGVPLTAGPSDLLVTVTIDVPQDTTGAERALLEQLRTLRT